MSRAIHKFRSAPIISIVDGARIDDNAAKTIYTFAASWAAETSNRVVVALILGEDQADSNRTINTVTIDGESSSILEQVTTSSSGSAVACIAVVFLPNSFGNSGDIVVTFSAAMDRASVQVVTLNNVKSVSATFNGSDSVFGSGPVSISSVTVSPGGIVIGCATNSNQVVASTWTNLTERSDADVSMRVAHAFDLAADFNSGDTVTWDMDSGTGRISAAVVSLR